jgi:hypothetical protein
MTMTPGWLPDLASAEREDADSTPDFDWPPGPAEPPMVEWTAGAPADGIAFAAVPAAGPPGEDGRSLGETLDTADDLHHLSADAAVGDARSSTDTALETIAHLCTELGRVTDRSDLERLMHGSADVLNAAGLVVWLWNESTEELQPALVCGYSERVLANLPRVRRDADNATAAAFRSGHPCEITATPHTRGALVAPLLAPDGCAGVLAIEWRQGVELASSVRAMTTLLAAALAQLAYRCQAPDADTHVEQAVPDMAPFRPAVHPDACDDGDDDEHLSPPPLPFTSVPERVIPVI